MKSFTAFLFAVAATVSVFAVEAPYDLLNNPGRVTLPPAGNPKTIHCTEKEFYIMSTVKDWSGYNVFTVDFKNNSKSEVKIFFRFFSTGINNEPGNHYYYKFYTLKPGQGWQTIATPLDTIQKNRNPVGWSKIVRIDCCFNGYNKGVKDFSVELRNMKFLTWSKADLAKWKESGPSVNLNGITKAEAKKIVAAMPDNAYFPARSYKDRAYWDQYPVSNFIHNRAEQKINAPMPEGFGPELWKVARTIRYGSKTPDPQGRAATQKWERSVSELGRILSSCVVMECKENKGRFMPQIIKALECLMSSPLGWPGYDSHDNVKDGWRYCCLAAMPSGASLATAYYILDDKLPEELRKKIRENIQEWIFNPVMKTLTLKEGAFPSSIHHGNWCMNWLAPSGNITPHNYYYLLVIAYSMPMSKEDRAWITLNAIKACNGYLNKYTPQGYITEGMGYWQMGFSGWLNVADYIKRATDSKVNMGKNPLVQNVAALAYNMQMAPGGLYAHFSDCGVGGHATPFHYLYYKKLNGFIGIDYYGEDMKGQEYFTATGVSLANDVLNTAGDLKKSVQLKPAPGRKAYHFDTTAQVLISRDAPYDAKIPFTFAMKGGHNGELHNQNDVGSFLVGLGTRFQLGDAGAPPYMSDTRSLVAGSGMHPVPVINGKLQGTGSRFQASTLDFKADEHSVMLKLDLRKAYDEPKLQSLVRTGKHDRIQKVVTITDSFKYSEPCDFGGCLTSYMPIKQISANVWSIGDLKVEFTVKGGELAFENITPNIEWRTKEKLNQLNYKFTKKLTSGEVRFKVTPASNK